MDARLDLEFCPRCGSGPRQKEDIIECPDCGRHWEGPRLVDIVNGEIILDASNRVIAPPQPTITDRPAGPWDDNAERKP